MKILYKFFIILFVLFLIHIFFLKGNYRSIFYSIFYNNAALPLDNDIL